MSHDNVGCKTTMSKMNRRNVLLGLGTAAAGSGIVFGSGAFTQVAAERNVSVSVDADDAEGAVLTFDDSRSGAVDVVNGEASITVGDVVDINQNSVAAVGVDVDDQELADAQQEGNLDEFGDESVEANGSLLVIDDEEDLDDLTLDRVEVSDPTDETDAIDAPGDFEVVITEFDAAPGDEPVDDGDTVRVAGDESLTAGNGLPLSFEEGSDGDSLAVGLLLVASDDATDEFDADITLVVSADENGE